MAVKIEIKGNFLYISDSDTNEVERLISSLVTFDYTRDEKYLSLKVENGTNQVSYEYRLYDTNGDVAILDENDTPFADLDTLETFLYTELGKSSLVGSEAELVGTGWGQYGDSQYTLLTPLVVSGSNTVTIDLDGLANTVTPQLPSGQDLYDTSTSKITPISSGDGYSLSIQFNGSNTSNNGDATLFIDIGGTFTRLFPKTFRFNRGAGVSHEYYFVFKMYSLDTFIANGGLIKLQSGTGTTSIHDIIIQIHRTHKTI